MKIVLPILLIALGFAVVWYMQASSSSLPEKAELLASNTVLAEFTGVQDQPCRFMTTLCPDRCDHATRLASFKVLENKAYEHPGKYGDDKLSPGDTAVVDVQKDIPGQPAEIAQTISRLTPGDVVTLTIVHYYVQQGQGQFPVRPAVSIQPAASRSAP